MAQVVLLPVPGVEQVAEMNEARRFHVTLHYDDRVGAGVVIGISKLSK